MLDKAFKRKRQNEPPPEPSNELTHVPYGRAEEKCSKIQFCQNAACRAFLSQDDIFCKRCSYCICHQSDDNKDPSLWLTWEFDSLDENESCGISCHLDCALTDERAGIIKSNCSVKFDGNFYCAACGKINGLMRIWHWKSTKNACPDNPTFIALRPQKRFKIMDLNPSVEYFCKVSLFSSKEKVGVWEAKWVTPASSENCIAALVHEKEETLRTAQIYSQVNSTNSSNTELAFEEHDAKLPTFDEASKCMNDGLHSPHFLEKVPPLSPSSLYPSTPCKLQTTRELPGAHCKKSLEESDYEYAVRMVKWLEHERHMDKDFRVKFLT
ncbi:hypothetical protein SLEP1_g42056 [Rubroshorea leprosula]|uniref:Uncharacterized protein n=1 Tax=Rubroshorea leprosula TaxID=152421 RepID=A0AAV5L9F4_9ROSI|nr:hypothetical protein SLEP1_g42056 [Rubroshorea leprosula]